MVLSEKEPTSESIGPWLTSTNLHLLHTITNLPHRRNCRLVWKARTVPDTIHILHTRHQFCCLGSLMKVCDRCRLVDVGNVPMLSEMGYFSESSRAAADAPHPSISHSHYHEAPTVTKALACLESVDGVGNSRVSAWSMASSRSLRCIPKH